MIRKLGAILIALALVLSIGLTPGVAMAGSNDVIAGNEVIDRDYGPDSWSDFYLMDRNNGFTEKSVMTGFSVYVGRESPFEFMVYVENDNGWDVVYRSGIITPPAIGVYSTSIDPVCIPADSYVGLYYSTDGAVPYDRGDPHFEWNTLERVVLFTDQEGTEVDFLHSGDREYSIAAHGFSVDNWDLTYTGNLFLPADDVILQATLVGTGIGGHSVDFYRGDDLLGSAETDANGVAELNLGAHTSGIYEVTAKVYCLEDTATLYVLDQYAKISGGIEGQGNQGQGRGRGAPTHAFEGFVGEVDGEVVGEIAINYRELGEVITFTPNAISFRNAAGIGVYDVLVLDGTFDSELPETARIILLDRDAHPDFPRGAVVVNVGAIADVTDYEIDNTPGETGPASWVGLDRGNIHVVPPTD